MFTKKYSYTLIKPDYKKFKQIQKKSREIYQEHVNCEFSYFIDRNDELKITELIKFKTLEDFNKAQDLDDHRLDGLILEFKEIVDFDSIVEDELIDLNIDED